MIENDTRSKRKKRIRKIIKEISGFCEKIKTWSFVLSFPHDKLKNTLTVYDNKYLGSDNFILFKENYSINLEKLKYLFPVLEQIPSDIDFYNSFSIHSYEGEDDSIYFVKIILDEFYFADLLCLNDRFSNMDKKKEIINGNGYMLNLNDFKKYFEYIEKSFYHNTKIIIQDNYVEIQSRDLYKKTLTDPDFYSVIIDIDKKKQQFIVSVVKVLSNEDLEFLKPSDSDEERTSLFKSMDKDEDFKNFIKMFRKYGNFLNDICTIDETRERIIFRKKVQEFIDSDYGF